MEELIRTLHEGNYSCVIRKGTETKVFTQKGVADLFELCENKEKFLENAVVADKVVGKGAASLMVKGGVKAVYADIISSPALALLKEHSVATSYLKETEYIINRSKNGMCPVESLCLNLHSIEDMYQAIYKFINKS